MEEEDEGGLGTYLCSRITLASGEKKSISITKGEISDVRKKDELCLVGRLWSEKSTNMEAFKTVLSRVWRTIGNVVFKEIQDNPNFLMQLTTYGGEAFGPLIARFSSSMSLTGRLLRLKWHSHRLPYGYRFMICHFYACLRWWAQRLVNLYMGDLEDVDLAGDGAGWGRYLRIRVRIDLSKPLERWRALHLGDQSYWVTLKYEKRPMFCFFYGKVVHGRLGCPKRQDSRVNAVEDKKQWGTWLRAEVRRQSSQSDRGGRSRRTSTAEGQDSDDGSGDEQQFDHGSSPSTGLPETLGLLTKHVAVRVELFLDIPDLVEEIMYHLRF